MTDTGITDDDLRDPCGWCGRKHRAVSMVPDGTGGYVCPEYARGRKARRGPWNEGMDEWLVVAQAEQIIERAR
jgi:hypothetical protein